MLKKQLRHWKEINLLPEHDITLKYFLTIDINKTLLAPMIYRVSKSKRDGLYFHELCGFKNLDVKEPFKTIFFKTCL